MPKRNYKEEVEQLIKAARKQGYRVRFDWESHVWRGMNPEAAKWLKKHGEYGKTKGRLPTRTIELNKYSETNNKERSQTLRHELIENKLMKKRGYQYPAAHKQACRKQSSIKAVK